MPKWVVMENVTGIASAGNGQAVEKNPLRTRTSRLSRRHPNSPRLAPINLMRMKHIPEGGSWRDVPCDPLPAGMKRARRCDHTKRYGRLRKDGMSSTVLTKCDLAIREKLQAKGWNVLVIRECEVKSGEGLAERVRDFLGRR